MSTLTKEQGKDEIIKKWIYHAPSLSLPEAVDKCMSEYAAQEVAKEREKARQAIEHCSELMSMQTAEIERLKDLIEGMWHRKVKSEYHFFNANYVTGQQWQQFKKENNL